MSKLEIYCDGSSEGNATGCGGYGYVIVLDGEELASGSDHLAQATNNSAELAAAVKGCHAALGLISLMEKKPDEVSLVSDSKLVLGYADGSYKCKALHLAPLCIELRKAYSLLKAKTRWVRGHNGDKYNEQCDKLAKAAKINP